MDEPAFWELIEKAGLNANDDYDAFTSYLETELFKMSETEILAFAEILHRKLSAANNRGLWGAACIINSGCSDGYSAENFEYFRGWLIARGKAVYETALFDPDALAEYINPGEESFEFESILYVAHYVYEVKTGREIPLSATDEPDQSDEEWEPGELASEYPRLTEKFNPLQFDSF